MTATFNWEILNIDCYPQLEDKTNVVFTIYWRCTGVETTDNGNTYSTFLERNTKLKYKDGDPFTEYSQLTNSQVLNWVWDAVVQTIKGTNSQPNTDVTTKEATETEIQNTINKQINPPVVRNPLPW